jgi:hypothetical protein
MATPEKMAGQFGALARDARQVPRRAVAKAATVVRKEVYDELARTPYRSRTLSNMGGVRLNVNYRTTGGTATVRANPPGPWAIVEEGAKAHPIKVRNRRALRLANGRVVARVQRHPGVPGHKPWERGVQRAEPKAVKAYEAEVDQSVERNV